jgi:ClpP class serine protease
MNDLLPDIGERLFGRPLLIEPGALHARLNSAAWRKVLTGENAGGAPREISTKTLRKKRMAGLIEADRVSVANGVADYVITPEGVAVVPVLGVLTARSDWFTTLCGWTTYEGLAAIFDSATREPRVKAILMDVESPGGEAAGMIDISERILAARKDKPVWAVANSYAFSAAYGIGGSAEKLFVPRLCQVGSIGAVCVHVDQSMSDKAMGLRYTAIFSGARKIDGWDHAPLSDDARASMQAGIDHCRAEFAALVARQGRMTVDEAMATEAGVFHDQGAVSAKLADVVGTFEDALRELSGGQSRGSSAQLASTKPEVAMATKPTANEKPAAEAPKAEVENAAKPAVAETPAADDDDEKDPKEKPAEEAAKPAAQAASNVVNMEDARKGFRAEAGEIRDLCSLAGMPELAGSMIAEGKTAAQARTILVEKRAENDAGTHINAHHAAPTGEAAGSWDKTIEKLNSRVR